MTTTNGATMPISAEHQHHSRPTTTIEDRRQCFVAEQIADLTIAHPLPALALSDLVTTPPQWRYELYVVGTFLTKRGMNIQPSGVFYRVCGNPDVASR
ncbi:hypothetical protein LINGRAHAP2_LOCUS14214 [Linum grandiflorum]